MTVTFTRFPAVEYINTSWYLVIFLINHDRFFLPFEEFEDTKGVNRIRKSKKNRQHNDQKKKNRQHNDQKKKDKQNAISTLLIV